MRSLLFYIFFTVLLTIGIGLIHVSIMLMCEMRTDNTILVMIVTAITGMVTIIISSSAIIYKISEECRE